MNPYIPDSLSDVIGIAEKSLDQPTGDLRRLDKIEQLFVRVHAAAEAPTDQPRRYVNEWTLQLMMMLRKIERAGPLGDQTELQRAATVGLALLPYIKIDLVAAMLAARASTTEHDFKTPVRGGA